MTDLHTQENHPNPGTHQSHSSVTVTIPGELRGRIEKACERHVIECSCELCTLTRIIVGLATKVPSARCSACGHSNGHYLDCPGVDPPDYRPRSDRAIAGNWRTWLGHHGVVV